MCIRDSYFGVQKNVAPAGMAIAIIRDDLLGKSAKGIPAEKIPTMMNYTTLLAKDSICLLYTSRCV